MPYYALKDPTGEESYDLFLLYKARKYKSFFIGTFYLRAPARVCPRFSAPSGPAVIVSAGPTGALSSSPPEIRRRVSGSAPELHPVR
jgi:hypothetical protein